MCVGRVGACVYTNMQRFSGIQAMEVAPADPVAEWAAPGGETGLEGRISSQFHLEFSESRANFCNVEFVWGLFVLMQSLCGNWGSVEGPKRTRRGPMSPIASIT